MFATGSRHQRTFIADLDLYPVEPSEDGPTATILIGIRERGNQGLGAAVLCVRSNRRRLAPRVPLGKAFFQNRG